MKLSWNWLNEYVKLKNSPVEAAERLTLAGLEVKNVIQTGDDFMLETEVTSNRADWLSHIGVAREIGAIYKRPLIVPAVKIHSVKGAKKISRIRIENRDVCPYYSCVELAGIKTIETPKWMRERLEVCGIRSVNFLVDVTNYVLFETGQPLHAFDLDKIQGNEIVIRFASKSERFFAIDNNLYELQSGDIVIADQARAIALGGVMGGKETEVSVATNSILLESANFHPTNIRKTSRRLKLFSDSSYRFERGVDPLGIDFARNRAAALIMKHAKTDSILPPISAGKLGIKKKKVQVNIPEIVKILGPVSIQIGDVKRILNSLGIKTKAVGNQAICEPPSFRPDIQIKEDLIEEVARIYGYDKIPETIPTAILNVPASDQAFDMAETIRNICEGIGLQEIVTYSIVNPQDYQKFEQANEMWVTIENPRNQNVTLMRPSLAQNMIEVMGRNINMGNRSLALFEIANTYKNTNELLPKETKMLALGLTGEKKASYLEQKRTYQFSDLKGIVEVICKQSGYPVLEFKKKEKAPSYYHPDHSFQILISGMEIGFSGLIKPSISAQHRIEDHVYYGEISIHALIQIKGREFFYQEISKYPLVERDLALIVDESVLARDLIGKIESLGRGWIHKIYVFDVYRSHKLPKGKKSIAFRIEFQSRERTLSAAEVNDLHFTIIHELNSQFKAELPSKVA